MRLLRQSENGPEQKSKKFFASSGGKGGPAHPVARVAAASAGQFQLQNHREHGGRLGSGLADQLVHFDGCGGERFLDPTAHMIGFLLLSQLDVWRGPRGGFGFVEFVSQDGA